MTITLSDLNALTTHFVQSGAAPGVSIALNLDGQTLVASAGMANAATGAPLRDTSRYQLGCITKLLTSIVSLELASADRFDLNMPISYYLPELRSTEIGEEVAPRHLLSHTSGYRGVNLADVGVRFYYNWDLMLNVLRAGEQHFRPGTVFDYEHTECVLLGAILERITGERIHDLYQKMVWRPLNVVGGESCTGNRKADGSVADHVVDATSGRFVPLRAAPHCAFWDASVSDITVTLPDLVALGRAIAGLEKRQVFSPDTICMLRKRQIQLPRTIGPSGREQIPVAFGFGCGQYGPSTFGHNGSARGQTCALRFDQASGVVFAVGLNCWRPNVRDLLCSRLLSETCHAVTPPPDGEIPNWTFGGLGGRYFGAHGIWVDVSVSRGRLELAINNAAFTSAVRLELVCSPTGSLELYPRSSYLGVGIFEAPGCSGKALMLGLNSLCRHL